MDFRLITEQAREKKRIKLITETEAACNLIPTRIRHAAAMGYDYEIIVMLSGKCEFFRTRPKDPEDLWVFNRYLDEIRGLGLTPSVRYFRVAGMFEIRANW